MTHHQVAKLMWLEFARGAGIPDDVAERAKLAPPATRWIDPRKDDAAMKIVEFKMNHALVNSEAGLTVHGVPMRHEETGKPVLAADLEVGKTYAVRADGVLLKPVSRQVKRAHKRARKGRKQ